MAATGLVEEDSDVDQLGMSVKGPGHWEWQHMPLRLLLYHIHSVAVYSGNEYINKPNSNIT